MEYNEADNAVSADQLTDEFAQAEYDYLMEILAK